MRRPGEIENVKKKIHVRARKMLRLMKLATLSGPVAVDEERLEAAAKNSVGEKEEQKGQLRLLRACSSAELGKVASGSATQSLWLKDKKVGSQVIGNDRSRLPWRGTV